MVKKYKIPLILLLVLLLAGFLARNENRIIYGISEGTYRMVTEEDSTLQPLIHFYMEDKGTRFVLGADERISFAYRGTVELDGRVNLYCENGGQKWIFEVVDNDTLRFVQRGSSEFPLKDGSLPDGAVFQYADER